VAPCEEQNVGNVGCVATAEILRSVAIGQDHKQALSGLGFELVALLTSAFASSAELISAPAATNRLSAPLGLEASLPIPEDNPLTPERIALGKKLFYDPILSQSGTISCSSCHLPERGFASDAALSAGIEGKKGRRNAPSLFNRLYAASLFWDGRVSSLEAQALEPIQNPVEMGSSLEAVLERLRANADYRQAFKLAFSDGISTQNLARAIASFERTLLSGNSPVDRFRNSQFSALSDSARQGLWIFESKGLCSKCHSGRNFTDEKFRNTGVSWGKAPNDSGRFEVTGHEADRGRFKTPTLRDVSKTAPYMHDGSLVSLREVVEFYNRGGVPNPNLDPSMKPLNLSDSEIQNLVDFLEALSGGKVPSTQLK